MCHGPLCDQSILSGRNTDSLACSTCNITATSVDQLAVHLDGKKHKRMTATAELRDLPEPDSDGPDVVLACDLCNVETGSALQQQYHLRYIIT